MNAAVRNKKLCLWMCKNCGLWHPFAHNHIGWQPRHSVRFKFPNDFLPETRKNGQKQVHFFDGHFGALNVRAQTNVYDALIGGVHKCFYVAWQLVGVMSSWNVCSANVNLIRHLWPRTCKCRVRIHQQQCHRFFKLTHTRQGTIFYKERKREKANYLHVGGCSDTYFWVQQNICPPTCRWPACTKSVEWCAHKW